MTTNFGAAAEDYARCRAGFPESLFERLAALGVGRSRQAIVDVGTGTGALARGFAKRGACVIGIDPDVRMLEQARKLDAEASVSIEYRVGRAETLPVADASVDAVSAAQCWHWFDGPTAAQEFARVTRVGGCVVLAHFDWLPLPGSLVEATERLILEHNPDWRGGGGDGFHIDALPPLGGAGFSRFETFSYDVDVPYTPEGWRGRIRASAGVGARLSPDGVTAFDRDLKGLLQTEFAGESLQIPHRVFAIVGRLGGNGSS